MLTAAGNVLGPADFSNTIGLSLFSPAPYTSGSGVFLTDVPAAEVPLPAALPLLASGVVLLGYLGRRRQRVTTGA
jgi:hypothetical protein